MAADRRRVLLPRLLLGVFFAAAAVPKILDPLGFAADVASYRLLPAEAVAPAALLLPWVELCSAAALLFLPSFREPATVLLLTLLAAFSAALAIALARGTALSCGCFGGWIPWLERPGVALARNVLLAAAGIWLLRTSGGSSTPATAPGPTSTRPAAPLRS